MIISFQAPIMGAIGKLKHDGKFYIRKIHGKYILQRCPNRKNHVPTPRERANQQRFIQHYRRVRSIRLEDAPETLQHAAPQNVHDVSYRLDSKGKQI